MKERWERREHREGKEKRSGWVVGEDREGKERSGWVVGVPSAEGRLSGLK